MNTLLLFQGHYEDSASLPKLTGQGGGQVGGSAQNSGQHTVSPAASALPPRRATSEPGTQSADGPTRGLPTLPAALRGDAVAGDGTGRGYPPEPPAGVPALFPFDEFAQAVFGRPLRSLRGGDHRAAQGLVGRLADPLTSAVPAPSPVGQVPPSPDL